MMHGTINIKNLYIITISILQDEISVTGILTHILVIEMLSYIMKVIFM